MKHYLTPELELLAVPETDVIATSLNIEGAFNWNIPSPNDWDWSI